MFYAERARSVEAATVVSSGLAKARTALREGRRADAAAAVAEISAQLADVRPDEGHDALVAEQQQLTDELAGPATGTDPVSELLPPSDTDSSNGEPASRC